MYTDTNKKDSWTSWMVADDLHLTAFYQGLSEFFKSEMYEMSRDIWLLIH